jgi:hypothetical protein
MGASSTLHVGMCSVLSNRLSMKREALFLTCSQLQSGFCTILDIANSSTLCALVKEEPMSITSLSKQGNSKPGNE